jgi:hypothetical protein
LPEDSTTRVPCSDATLKERVASLHGTLVVESSGNGARLEITVPLTRKGA